MNLGIVELLIIVILVLFLFGAPILTFIIGYTIGQRRSKPAAPDAQGAGPIPAAPEEPKNE